MLAVFDEAVDSVIGAQGKHLAAILGHQQGVLPLGGVAAILGGHGPAILRIDLAVILLAVDHGLDGEAHACFQLQLAAVAVVEDLRLFVELGTDAVAAVVTHHGETGLLDDWLNNSANLGNAGTRTHLLDSGVEALLRNLAELAAQRGGFTHDEHGRGIAVVTILDNGDIQVDDVAIAQLLVVRDAVTDHIVHRGADGFGEAVVVERSWNRLLYVDNIVVAEGVQFVSGDASFDMGRNHDQHIGGQLAGNAHLFNLFRCLDFNGHGISLAACHWACEGRQDR
ncbi:conserved hypothetical protein [Aeromonas veronii]|uniref:NAD-specific glutamate dehydrogenase n=1 Tax=Aeromonas veronii TaxID=654 RepID=A0A653KRU0_AERVE|nr:conserved hypothetical protein [Aeromonas veronii]